MTNPITNYWVDTSKDMDLNNFERIGNIGTGLTSNTVQYKEKNTQNKYCVKIFTPEFARTYGNSSFLKEVSLLSQMDNPAVLSLYGFNIYSQFVHNPIIITKYYPKSLSYYIRSNYAISMPKKYIIILGIAEGMKYLHSISITHRDLKPENILLDENDRPIICDLGHSRFGSQGMNTDVGSYGYMAPEIKDGNYSNKIDVFSFAIVFYEIFTQHPAYNNIPTDSVDFLRRVYEGFRPDDSIFTNNILKTFVNDCWAAEPTERPTFNEIINRIKSNEFKRAMEADENEVTNYLSRFDHLHDASTIKHRADEGDIQKAVEYADMLRTGENVPNVDEDGALHYYRIAAENNHTYAMQQCALLLIKRNSKDEAADYLKRAIRLGDDDALQVFIDEKLDELNRDEVADLFKTSADHGSTKAMCKYALMLYMGYNVEQNKREAFRYFKNAADLGNAEANGYTGLMYDDGDSINANHTQATFYFLEGIRRNDTNSMLFYAISKLNDSYSAINKNEIVDLFKRSADLGNQAAMLCYATILLYGYLDVERNKRFANDYINRVGSINSKEAANVAYIVVHKICEGKIKFFQKSDSKLFFTKSLEIYVNALPKDKALECLMNTSKLGSELARKMYCKLYGLFHEIFYSLEEDRRNYEVDVVRHIVGVIFTACSDSNKAKLIAYLKRNNVNNIEDTIREIKAAFRFVYIKNQNDEEQYRMLDDERIRRILEDNLSDSDFA